MGTRYRDTRLMVYDLGDEFLVRCPRCAAQARVVPLGADSTLPSTFHARCTCLHCGYQRERHGGDSIVIYHGADWYFGLPVWLQTPCRGHTLWAYNARHLAFLEDYARATLREAPTGEGWARNQTLASRLPRWIKSGHHRDDVLAGIERLKRLLE
ncbi:MAG TPA: hypothetical protein VGR57_04590 [Ktedonobacterales bacterium]|nr:hypothetical protein [Ktedonobacterales bacterium]